MPVQPMGRASFDLNAFLLSLPPIVCFMLGFFFSVGAIVLVYYYFWNPPTVSPARGWATVWGILASFAVGCCLAFVIIAPAFI